jgi:hypothetical protein
MIGRRIAHYVVTAEIGSGGMGTVDRAEDTRLNRRDPLLARALEDSRFDELRSFAATVSS